MKLDFIIFIITFHSKEFADLALKTKQTQTVKAGKRACVRIHS